LSFVSLSWSKITGKYIIKWQNFARVRLQIKFALIIRPIGVGEGWQEGYRIIRGKPEKDLF